MSFSNKQTTTATPSNNHTSTNNNISIASHSSSNLNTNTNITLHKAASSKKYNTTGEDGINPTNGMATSSCNPSISSRSQTEEASEEENGVVAREGVDGLYKEGEESTIKRSIPPRTPLNSNNTPKNKKSKSKSNPRNRMVVCPICNKEYPKNGIERHANICLGEEDVPYSEEHDRDHIMQDGGRGSNSFRHKTRSSVTGKFASDIKKRLRRSSGVSTVSPHESFRGVVQQLDSMPSTTTPSTNATTAIVSKQQEVTNQPSSTNRAATNLKEEDFDFHDEPLVQHVPIKKVKISLLDRNSQGVMSHSSLSRSIRNAALMGIQKEETALPEVDVIVPAGATTASTVREESNKMEMQYCSATAATTARDDSSKMSNIYGEHNNRNDRTTVTLSLPEQDKKQSSFESTTTNATKHAFKHVTITSTQPTPTQPQPQTTPSVPNEIILPPKPYATSNDAKRFLILLRSFGSIHSVEEISMDDFLSSSTPTPSEKQVDSTQDTSITSCMKLNELVVHFLSLLQQCRNGTLGVLQCMQSFQELILRELKPHSKSEDKAWCLIREFEKFLPGTYCMEHVLSRKDACMEGDGGGCARTDIQICYQGEIRKEEDVCDDLLGFIDVGGITPTENTTSQRNFTAKLPTPKHLYSSSILPITTINQLIPTTTAITPNHTQTSKRIITTNIKEPIKKTKRSRTLKQRILQSPPSVTTSPASTTPTTNQNTTASAAVITTHNTTTATTPTNRMASELNIATIPANKSTNTNNSTTSTTNTPKIRTYYTANSNPNSTSIPTTTATTPTNRMASKLNIATIPANKSTNTNNNTTSTTNTPKIRTYYTANSNPNSTSIPSNPTRTKNSNPNSTSIPTNPTGTIPINTTQSPGAITHNNHNQTTTPRLPQKPLNAFTYFCRVIKPQLRSTHTSETDVQNETKSRWRLLQDAERALYIQMSQRDHNRYKLEWRLFCHWTGTAYVNAPANANANANVNATTTL